MEGDRNGVWGLAGEVEEASLLSVFEKSAQVRENDMRPDEGRDSAQLPVEVLPTQSPLCCVEQDTVPSLQPDFCVPSCFGNFPAKSWRGSELDC